METVPIAQTIDLAKAGNEEALSTLYIRFKPHISSYVHRRVNLPYVADDIVSDVFTKFMESIHTFYSNDPRALHRWLIIVADARIADYWRTSNVRRTDPLDNSRQFFTREIPLDSKNPDHNPISWDDPALTIEFQERDTIIHQAVRKLSTDAHKVIVGRIVDGLSVRVIASMIGKSPAATRKICERGLRYLRSLLTPVITVILAVGLCVAAGALFFVWNGNSASRDIGYPVNQSSPHTGVTPTPTAIIVPSYILPPTPVPTPVPSPTPTETPVPTPVPTQQTSQTPSLTQDLPVNICVMGVCSR